MRSIEQALIAAAERSRFSRRKRAIKLCQKANDLAREAVSCNAGLGGRLGQLSLCARAELLLASLVELE